MGKMVDGRWLTDEDMDSAPQGAWERAESKLRHWITPTGAPGPAGGDGFMAMAGRYHLFAAWNCPWAHRALLTRKLKGLDRLINVSFVAPRRTDQGWIFDREQGYADHLFGASALHEIYARGAHNYSGRATVPVLFDKQTDRIVSNESAEIVRMLGSAFDAIGANTLDLYPEPLRDQIDAWNDLIYTTLNNGVYRAGFATDQRRYEEAARGVFSTLEIIEEQLARTRYLCGNAITEADIRLFPTLTRFDVGYYSAFKCNQKRLTDYPHLWDYARAFYALPGVSETVDFEIYKRGYHSPNPNRNPHGIVPVGPDIDWTEPHQR
ncbi:MAG: glutathione S-transferase C-terminal domain-containing protein [Pseudomonadota bacterium]